MTDCWEELITNATGVNELKLQVYTLFVTGGERRGTHIRWLIEVACAQMINAGKLLTIESQLFNQRYVAIFNGIPGGVILRYRLACYSRCYVITVYNDHIFTQLFT